MEKPLVYHHCIHLEGVKFGTVKPDPNRISDEDFRPAYQWLADRSGYWPMFLGVGNTEDDIGITGYRWQFTRKKIHEALVNRVLFSFDENDLSGVFTDYDYWHIALSDPNSLLPIEIQRIFKSSWSPSKWHKKAENDPGSVQLTTPELHLPDAKRIWVRNKPTKKLLENMGFTRVEVKRLLVPRWSW